MSQPASTALFVVAGVRGPWRVSAVAILTAVAALWVRVLGLAVLVASTVLTLWARFSLGTMWSVAPRVQGDQRLRTHGPYAVPRHPIYTGVLGMLVGATLVSGIGSGSCSSRPAWFCLRSRSGWTSV